MTLPLFRPEDDPGPNFLHLLRKLGQDPFARVEMGDRPAVENTHATTIAAIRYADGVVMAGDRRATAGSSIAHRGMEKVQPADRHSGVAFSGSAGIGMEMVRVFQLQLEHYEKVEGSLVSLEGKANQLSQLVKSNLSMAMQGFVVVPLFAGYDTARSTGRIFSYDATGGHYEETDFQATGSGGRDARSTIKLGWREGLSQDDAVELAIRSLYEAADEDSATGGPDLVRGIYPLIAVVDAEGYRAVPEDEVAERFGALIARARAERAEQSGQGGQAGSTS